MNNLIFKWINIGWGSPALDPVMLFITNMGEGVVVSGVSLIIIIYGLIKKNDIVRNAGYSGFISFIITSLLSPIFKNIFHTPRPMMVIYNSRYVGEALFANSFPSGHTMTAFGFGFAVFCIAPRSGWVLFPIAVLIGISRIYVGAHFPYDVLGGMIIGALSGILSAHLTKKLIRGKIEQPAIPQTNIRA